MNNETDATPQNQTENNAPKPVPQPTTSPELSSNNISAQTVIPAPSATWENTQNPKQSIVGVSASQMGMNHPDSGRIKINRKTLLIAISSILAASIVMFLLLLKTNVIAIHEFKIYGIRIQREQIIR